MNRKQAKILIHRYEKEFSIDFHNQFTPFEICDEMLSKIERLNSEMDILVMFNLEFIYTLSEKFGKKGMKNVWFLTPCDMKKKVAIAMGINENKVLTYSYNDRKIIGEENMPKFDVVVLNPPFHRNMHLDFLELAYKTSKEWVICVHPSVWILHEEGLKLYKRYKNLIRNSTLELTFFNGNPIFNTKLFYPFVIDVINKKQNTYGKIKVIDKLRDKILIYDDIDKINKWSDLEIYPKLRGKILEYSKKDNLEKHWYKKDGEFYINLAYVRGNVETQDPNKIFQEDFYTIIPKKLKIENAPSKSIWFSFKTQNEAENFLKFLKLRWTMFSLSFNKINQHFKGGALRTIPWLDWSEPWTEERFEQLISASPEEKEFVYKNIPKYYE
jgi:hypothetical protein